MSIHTTEAIVLRRYPFRETSVTLSCLTDRFGKLKGLVKGLRASPSRYRSAMEPLTVNRIVFYETRSSQLHLISQCDLLDPLDSLQRDLETMQLAAFCANLVDAVVPVEEPHAGVYQLFKHTLERLALGAGEPSSVRLHFVVRLLRLAGFHPQLDECVGCGASVNASGHWSTREGGLLCASCLHQDLKAEPASADVLGALKQLSDAAQPPPIDAAVLPRLNQRLTDFLHWRLDRPLKLMMT
jgi:DNA repair protein RecO (recombination protein O)